MNTHLPQSSLLKKLEPSLTLQPKKPHVTIVIGFTQKDGVVLASDSRMTMTPGTTIDDETNKVSKIELNNGTYALIARSGVLGTADVFQERFEQKAKTTEITSPRTVANMAQDAMKETREALCQGFCPQFFDKDDLKIHLLNYHCEILLGYSYGSENYLYTLRLDAAIALPNRDPFVVMGCGQNVARFAIAGFVLNALPIGMSLGLTAYAIEMCKTHDSSCGGRIQMGILADEGRKSRLITRGTSSKYEWLGQKLGEQARSSVLRAFPETINKNRVLN